MSSISTRRKRSSVSSMTITTSTATTQKTSAKVSCRFRSRESSFHDRNLDLPPRTPSKKQQHDEESVTSSKRDGSPVLKKASATLQLRSTLYISMRNALV